MISVFQEAENLRRTTCVELKGVHGFGYVNLSIGSAGNPKISRKHKVSIKKGVRLSSKYISARR